MERRITVDFKDVDSGRKANSIANLPTEIFSTCPDRASAQIICGHNSNFKGHNGSSLETDYTGNYPEKLIVIYSGTGDPKLSQIDISSTRVLKINRKIDRGHDGITPSEWKQIYSLIDIDRNKFTSHEIQSIGNECLATFAILCQGYLVVYDQQTEIAHALHAMQWSNFLDRTANINDNIEILKTKSDHVTNPVWWSDIFNKDLIRVTFEETQLKIAGKIAQEWNSNDIADSSFGRLLKAIYIDKAIEPTIVANAYCAIAQKLGKYQPEIFLPDDIAINKLPNSVMILGSNPVASAISQVLDLFDIQSYQYPALSQDLNTTSDFKYDLAECPWVISLASSPIETMSQLRRLRSHFCWEGKFVAIAASESSLQPLKQFDVFGDCEGNFEFTKIPGQIAIGQPIFLRDLLFAPYATKKMYFEGWQICQDRSGIGKLRKRVNCVELLMTNSDRSGSDQIVDEILQEMSNISWATILPHADIPMVKALLGLRDRATSQHNMEYIPEIHRILSVVLGEAL